MIIGLVGFIGSGKGTVGDFLEQDHHFIKDSFAAPLKDAVALIFGWDREMVEGASQSSRAWREQPDQFWTEKFGYTFTPRMALQLMGTEAGRNVFHPDIWVASLLNRCNKRMENTVITDVRFKNEVAAIHQEGGIIVRVRRGPEPEWFHTAFCANRGNTAAVEEMKTLGIHQSEWDWVGSPIRNVIYNDDTISSLRDQVRHIVAMAEIFEHDVPTRQTADQAIRM